jgi:hypothetical protein
MVQTYRKFKQLLKLAKTRRLRRGDRKRRRRALTRRKKQKGGQNPFSGESTVVAPAADEDPALRDLEEVPVVRSARNYQESVDRASGH